MIINRVLIKVTLTGCVIFHRVNRRVLNVHSKYISGLVHQHFHIFTYQHKIITFIKRLYKMR